MCMSCGELCSDDDGRKRDRNRKLAAQSPAKNICRKCKLANANVECDTCKSACQKIDGFQDNKYLDTQFIHCQMIQEANSGYEEDNNDNQQ